MSKSLRAKKLSNDYLIQFICGASSLVTLFFFPYLLNPISLAKLPILIVTLAFANLLWIKYFKNSNFGSSKSITFLPIVFFAMILILAAISSPQNYQRTLLGAWGRNNGFIAYFCLINIFFIVFANITYQNFEIIPKFIANVSLIVVPYGVLQNAHSDFVNWNYAGFPVILTLGNENFAGILLSLILVSVYFYLNKIRDFFMRIIFILIEFMTVYLIIRIENAQSLLILLIFLSWVTINFVLNRHERFRAKFKYVSYFICIGTLVAILVILQSNKSSAFSRIYHWKEALLMMRAYPYTGIGIDSFYDYQPFFRVVMENGEPDTYADNAHNIYLHFGATGGIFLLLSYLLVNLWVARRLYVLTSLNKLESSQKILIVSLFLVITMNDLVSIDNIGLAVWFWVIKGAIVGLSFKSNSNILTKSELNAKRLPSKVRSNSYVLTQKFAIVLAIFFTSFSAFISTRQVVSEYRIKILFDTLNSNVSNNAYKIYSIASQSKEQKIMNLAILNLYKSNQWDLGLKLAEKTIEHFPRDVDALELIADYQLRENDVIAVRNTLMQILELDPLHVAARKFLEDNPN